jgi:hypothetical protein
MACEIRIGDRGKDSVFFMSDVDELDFAVAAQPIDDWIQSVSNNAIATLDTSFGKHFPQNVCNRLRHRMTLSQLGN